MSACFRKPCGGDSTSSSRPMPSITSRSIFPLQSTACWWMSARTAGSSAGTDCGRCSRKRSGTRLHCPVSTSMWCPAWGCTRAPHTLLATPRSGQRSEKSFWHTRHLLPDTHLHPAELPCLRSISQRNLEQMLSSSKMRGSILLNQPFVDRCRYAASQVVHQYPDSGNPRPAGQRDQPAQRHAASCLFCLEVSYLIRRQVIDLSHCGRRHRHQGIAVCIDRHHGNIICLLLQVMRISLQRRDHQLSSLAGREVCRVAQPFADLTEQSPCVIHPVLRDILLRSRIPAEQQLVLRFLHVMHARRDRRWRSDIRDAQGNADIRALHPSPGKDLFFPGHAQPECPLRQQPALGDWSTSLCYPQHPIFLHQGERIACGRFLPSIALSHQGHLLAISGIADHLSCQGQRRPQPMHRIAAVPLWREDIFLLSVIPGQRASASLADARCALLSKNKKIAQCPLIRISAILLPAQRSRLLRDACCS